MEKDQEERSGETVCYAPGGILVAPSVGEEEHTISSEFRVTLTRGTSIDAR